MKLNFVLLSALSLFTACASKNAPLVNNSREIASMSENCKFVKHHKENMYQMMVDGKAFNQIWYTKPELDGLKSRLVEKGVCQ